MNIKNYPINENANREGKEVLEINEGISYARIERTAISEFK